MSNILPQEARKSTWRIYRSRLVAAGALVMTATAAFSALALLPSYLVLSSEMASPAPQTAEALATQEDRVAIARMQMLMNALSPLVTSATPTSLIAEALSVRPSGVRVDHVSAAAGDPGTIIVSGTASQAEALSEYQGALRSHPHFTSVSVPVGDLAGTAGGSFSITLSAEF